MAPVTKASPRQFAFKSAIIGFSIGLLPACALPPSTPNAVTPQPPPRRTADKSTVHNDVRQVREAVAALIRREMDAYQVPGLTIALVKGQHVVWAEGFGVARAGTDIAVDADTVFRAGSLAKPLLATAVLQLDETRALDIDQPYGLYVPEFALRSRFARRADPITPRMLLYHHAGVPTDLNKGMWSDRPFQAVLHELRDEYAVYPPNTVFSYSNIGYSLLGILVERTSARPFDDYMRDEVFGRIGMARSAFLPPDGPVASGHVGGVPVQALPIRDRPAFGLYTTANDMAAFIKTLLAHGAAGRRTLLHEGTVADMLTPQNTDVPLDLDLRFGLGWLLEYDTIPEAGRVVRQGGTTLHFNAELIVLPDADWGVIVLSNAGNARPVVRRIAEAALTTALGKLPAQKPAGPDWTRPQLDEVLPGLPSEGVYATELGLMTVEPEKGKLCACMYQKQYDLFPLPGGWFALRGETGPGDDARLRILSRLQLRFENVDQHEVLIARDGAKRQVLGQRIDGVIPSSWQNFVGRYHILNPDPDFPVEQLELHNEHGTLCLSYRMPKLSPLQIRLPLQPVSASEAIVVGLGRSRGDTVFLEIVDGQPQLRYSGYHAERLNQLASDGI